MSMLFLTACALLSLGSAQYAPTNEPDPVTTPFWYTYYSLWERVEKGWIEAPEPTFTTICQGEKGWIQCKQYELIDITRVFWGRDDYETCAKVPAGLTADRLCECNAENSMIKVEGQCKNEQACEVLAWDEFFDDNSCGNLYKYLKIYYECVPDESNAVDILRGAGDGGSEMIAMEVNSRTVAVVALLVVLITANIVCLVVKQCGRGGKRYNAVRAYDSDSVEVVAPIAQ